MGNLGTGSLIVVLAPWSHVLSRVLSGQDRSGLLPAFAARPFVRRRGKDFIRQWAGHQRLSRALHRRSPSGQLLEIIRPLSFAQLQPIRGPITRRPDASDTALPQPNRPFHIRKRLLRHPSQVRSDLTRPSIPPRWPRIQRRDRGMRGQRDPQPRWNGLQIVISLPWARTPGIQLLRQTQSELCVFSTPRSVVRVSSAYRSSVRHGRIERPHRPESIRVAGMPDVGRRVEQIRMVCLSGRSHGGAIRGGGETRSVSQGGSRSHRGRGIRRGRRGEPHLTPGGTALSSTDRGAAMRGDRGWGRS